MTEIRIKRHKIVLFKSADELPILRYSKFQKYQIIESGIGSNIESIAVHFSRLFEFLNHNMGAEALEEAKNTFYNFYNLLEGNNLPAMQFATLVYSVDGKPVADLTESGLEALVKRISGFGLTQQQVKEYVDEIKKKIGGDLKMIAPSFFNDVDSFTLYGHIKNKVLILAAIGQQKHEPTAEQLEQLRQLDFYIIKESKPDNFDEDNPENAVLRCDQNFEHLCAVLETYGVVHARELTVFQFYSRLEHFKKNRTAAPPPKDIKQDIL